MRSLPESNACDGTARLRAFEGFLERRERKEIIMGNMDLFDLSKFTDFADKKFAFSETCNAGAYAEIKFACEAIKNGFEVFTPLSHATKSDIVIMRPRLLPIRI